MTQTNKTKESNSQVDRDELERRQARLESLLEARGRAYRHASFDNYVLYHDRQRKSVAMLSAYVDDFRRHFRDCTGVLLYGPSRTGKGHLAVSMCRRMILEHGAKVAIKNCRFVYQEYRDLHRNSMSESKWFDRFAWQHFLVLEDPFAGDLNVTSAQEDVLYRLLEMRSSERRPTMFTTNVTSLNTFRDQITERNWRRIGDQVLSIDCNWPSFSSQCANAR